MTMKGNTAMADTRVENPTLVVRIRQAAQLLVSAAREQAPCAPVRVLLGNDLKAAYEVQELVIATQESPANPRVGRKVGLTSPAVQRQLGVDQPDFGVLLAEMDVSGLAEIPSDSLLQSRIEAEVAFVLREDITSPDRESVTAAVDYAVAALEIVDSRISDWDISITDTVADNASSALFVLGDRRVPLTDFVPAEVEMTLQSNGVEVSSGNGAACLGDPINALVWVAETAHRLGRPLRAGEVVLSGALGPMVPFRPGDRVEAVISGLGTVSASAAAAPVAAAIDPKE